MKKLAIGLGLAALLGGTGCSGESEEPLRPLAAASNSINESLPDLILPDYIAASSDSVAGVITEHRRAIEAVFNVVREEFKEPGNAVVTESPVPITYSEQRRSERTYLVYYWELGENTLARQISTDSTAFFLDLYRRTPNDLGAYLPIVLGQFSLDYQRAQLDLHAASAIGNKVVSTTVYASLTYAPSLEPGGWDISFEEKATQSSLRLLADGSGSLNQTHKEKTLFAEWQANGQGTYFLYDQGGQEIDSGSW